MMTNIIIFLITLHLLMSPIIGDENECGTIKVRHGISFINNGEPAYHGQFPWLAPLLHTKKGYLCGSSIITQWHLLTAAHCVLSQDEVKNYYTLLGRFDLSNNSEEHWQRRNMTRAYIHEDYYDAAELQKSDGDIAILRVSTKIIYSQFIQPICLPVPVTNIINTTGIVAGYGKTEMDGEYQDKPSYVRLKSINTWQCQRKGLVYAKFVAEKSFCAGDFANEDSIPCQGDSGGAFIVRNLAKHQYTIYGIVSHGIARCNPKDFVVFVDVPKYMQWINDKLELDQMFYGESTDPCESVNCGDGAECRSIDDEKTECICSHQYFGTYPNCESGCSIDQNCSDNRKCVNKVCTNLCLIASICVVESAECVMKNHKIGCECVDGYEGNAYTSCVKSNTASDECGKIAVEAPISSNIERYESVDGQFPWFATLFYENEEDSQRICGSTIISQWHLLTAAHCVNEKREYFVILGHQSENLANANDYIRRDIDKIFIHKDYKTNSILERSDGDIAILKVSKIIQYTSNIGAICLPSANAKAKDVNGLIVGFKASGYNFNNFDSSLSHFTIKSISAFKCLTLHKDYKIIVSSRSFCIGNQTNIPCLGDGGSGFYVYDETTQQYSIKGIFLFATSRRCTSQDFVASVDVSKYLPWIQTQMQCDYTYCGEYGECKVLNNKPVCSCRTEFFGTYPRCSLRCSTDENCPNDRACQNRICKNLCSASCDANSRCKMVNHRAVCINHTNRASNDIPKQSTNLNQIEMHENYNLINSQSCGTTSVEQFGRSKRIVNGFDAKLLEMPWAVLLGVNDNNKYSWICSGNLIHERFVLTAANCLARDLIIARLGEHRISTSRDCNDNNRCADPVQDRRIEKKIKHLMYNSETHINDIGMIKWDTPADTTKNNVKTICLPVDEDNDIHNILDFKQPFTIFGWGNYSDVLQKAYVDYVDHDKCIEAFKLIFNFRMYQTQFCALGFYNVDASQVDAGGGITALAMHFGTQKVTIYGVVSFGVLHGSSFPIVYTDLRYFLDWILDNMS